MTNTLLLENSNYGPFFACNASIGKEKFSETPVSTDLSSATDKWSLTSSILILDRLRDNSETSDFFTIGNQRQSRLMNRLLLDQLEKVRSHSCTLKTRCHDLEPI